MNPERVKHGRLPEYRSRQLIDQNNICPLCGQFILLDKAVVDHCHRTGRIRSVVHRGCNSLLGKIENNFKRYGLTLEQLKGICPNIHDYIHRDYQDHPFHPSYKEKLI